ncbi:MAG: FHA domain-containing protein [Ruminococcus sp.]|nr:FHA domain-containing protein [Ruminococcus sp.]
MENEYIVLFAVIAIIVLLIIIALILLSRSTSKLPKKRRRDVYINGGANINSGWLESNFKSTSGYLPIEANGTYVVNIYTNTNRSHARVRLRSVSDGRVYTLPVVDEVVLGRGTSGTGANYYGISTLRSVSKSHCTISKINGVLCVKDNHSTNHTYLNNRMVKEYVRIYNGDILRLGNEAEYRVELS